MSLKVVNFSTNQRRYKRNGIVLCFLIATCCATLVGMLVTRDQLIQARAQLTNSHIEAPSTLTQSHQTTDRRLLDFWSEQKANWSALFSALEQAGSNDITLLQIEPKFSDRKVTISGLARDHETVDRYLGKLESSTVIGQVELQRYRRTTISPNGLEFHATGVWESE
ncbi:MAG: PilN domain-containing protein [Limnobacter sp.]|uniref:PilN domain-containing protein n=1 Tax=Limnobacter sp. TaxID=2003368 RepID=UPI00391DFAED